MLETYICLLGERGGENVMSLYEGVGTDSIWTNDVAHFINSLFFARSKVTVNGSRNTCKSPHYFSSNDFPLK